MTPQEVATRLRVTAYTVRRWIATGVLEAETIKEGKRNRHRIKKLLIDTRVCQEVCVNTFPRTGFASLSTRHGRPSQQFQFFKHSSGVSKALA